MLFWPGVPGQFMGMLPVTLIFVLSASLVVALVYLPVMGGVTGRLSRVFGNTSDALRAKFPWIVRAILVPPALYSVFLGAFDHPWRCKVPASAHEDQSGPSPHAIWFGDQSADWQSGHAACEHCRGWIRCDEHVQLLRREQQWC